MAWRALVPPGHMTSCGCETDNDSMNSEHIESHKDQSSADFGRVHHYYEGQTPKSYCMTHKAERPCECDVKTKVKKSVPPPKSKTKAKR